ncbi:MAG: archaeosortase/exosortase family protein [Burkholderiaceae bacterium]|jgi:exosortase/archaeosortase family protein|nr:archaeosortase/exosortase family protein [Burkholderiaceae bacterium]
MSDVLNARVGRTLPNPLFGVLVPMAQDPTAAADEAGRGWHARWHRLRGAPAFAAAAPLALLLAALWPHLAWIARRLTDGSDEPWGILALATVLVLVARDRAQLAAPTPRALIASGALAVLAAAALWWLPALLAAAIAMLAIAICVTAMLPRRPATPMVTLLLLSLPLIASLQFYLGFPLRVATAQAAAPLLALLGIEAAPAGAALLFDGRTVLIDAPCAGIGMLWVGSYTAALLSYLNGAGARRTLANGVGATAIVFAANLLRNVALFFVEAGLIEAPAAAHDAVGLAAFALAIVPIVALTQWRTTPAAAKPPHPIRAPSLKPPRLARATYVGACLAAAVVPLVALAVTRDAGDAAAPVRSSLSSMTAAAIDWPTTFRGQPLTQLALTPLEVRFAHRFPGAIARFGAGREVLVLRHVTQPTRQLHPAADCFRAAGFTTSAPRAHVDADGAAWSCFVADRDGERLRVCERIERADRTQAWTDVSAWYWSALRARGSDAAWWATTVITPLAVH